MRFARNNVVLKLILNSGVFRAYAHTHKHRDRHRHKQAHRQAGTHTSGGKSIWGRPDLDRRSRAFSFGMEQSRGSHVDQATPRPLPGKTYSKFVVCALWIFLVCDCNSIAEWDNRSIKSLIGIYKLIEFSDCNCFRSLVF